MKFVLLALFVAAAAAVPSQKNGKVVEPSPVIMPAPALPEVVGELPAPALPEVVEELPAPQGNLGEIFNDGTVQVSVNAPEDPSMFTTLQSWFNMVVNYISNGVETTSQQIV